MPEFLEVSAYRHGLLAVVKSGTNFSLSGGRHHVVKDLGDGMYRAVKRGSMAVGERGRFRKRHHKAKNIQSHRYALLLDPGPHPARPVSHLLETR